MSKKFDINPDKLSAFLLNEIAALQAQVSVSQSLIELLMTDRFPDKQEVVAQEYKQLTEIVQANAFAALLDRLYLDSEEMKQQIRDLLG